MRFVILLMLLSACSPALQIKKHIQQAEQSQQDHIGFLLYDPASKKKLVQYRDDHYFTPASNTKIFTLYTSLKLLGDSIRAINYVQRNDSTIFWGLGDPSFLNPLVYQNTRVFDFLQQAPGKLIFSSGNFKSDLLGYGWSWDDYNYDYSAERMPLPMYGNLVTIKKENEKLVTEPRWFEQNIVNSNQVHEDEEVVRGIDDNQLTYYFGRRPIKKQFVPFHYSPDLLADLLSDTLKRQVETAQIPFQKGNVLKSTPVDSIYRVFMQDSDNFIAEHLLLQSAAVVSDTLQTEVAIRYAIKNLLASLPDKPRWVDGSGLSRFNLFTPRSIVHVWEKLYQEIPRERLFRILAVGGRSGTLRNSYKSDSPFIFGKTGSLTNHHALSGFLITKKGKTLLFCWMNSNFVKPTSEIRKEMEKTLREVKERY